MMTCPDCKAMLCRYDDYLLEDATHSHGDYDDVHTGLGWEVDSFWRPPRVHEQDHVRLDPHVLANPAIADIDGDGQAELVLDQYSGAVSFMLLQATLAAVRTINNETLSNIAAVCTVLRHHLDLLSLHKFTSMRRLSLCWLSLT